MFANIRRHQKWLWVVISSAVIISFVWYFNPDNRYGNHGGGALGNSAIGSMNGRPVTRNEYMEAGREAQLQYLFRFGQWPKDDQNARQFGWSPERGARDRVILAETLRQQDVRIGDAAVAQWIAEAFRDPKNNTFRLQVYQDFVKQLPAHGLSEKDFTRFVRHQVGIEHLGNLASATGKLIPPQEAEELYRKENEKVDAQVVFFNATNYAAQVKMDPAAIATFYTNRSANYAIPERLQVGYVAFESSNFLAAADQKIKSDTNFAARVAQMYEKRGANFYTDTNGAPMAPEAAKEKIKAEARQEFALLEARKQAIDFASKLIEMTPKAVTNLEVLAKQNGLKVQLTAPFSQFSSPAGLNVPDTFGRVAASLSPEEPFSEQPIVGEDAVYIIAHNKRIPREIPSLESVRAQVTEDYRRAESLKLAQAAGVAFQAAATNGLALKTEFQAIAQAGKLTAVKLSPFSQTTSTIPELASGNDTSSVKNSALALTPGQAGPFVRTRDGGFVVYVAARLPVSEIPKEELHTFMDTLRKRRQGEAFEEWFRKETELARVSLPGDKTERE